MRLTRIVLVGTRLPAAIGGEEGYRGVPVAAPHFRGDRGFCTLSPPARGIGFEVPGALRPLAPPGDREVASGTPPQGRRKRGTASASAAASPLSTIEDAGGPFGFLRDHPRPKRTQPKPGLRRSGPPRVFANSSPGTAPYLKKAWRRGSLPALAHTSTCAMFSPAIAWKGPSAGCAGAPV